MSIKYERAHMLEAICRYTHSCAKDEMGGVISANWFQKRPFDAALISLAPLWRRADFGQLCEFFNAWEPIFREEEIADELVLCFVQDLRKLVHKIKDAPNGLNYECTYELFRVGEEECGLPRPVCELVSQ